MEDPNLTPSLAPPAGVTPDFVTPESLSDINVVAIILCLALSTLLCSVQIYTKYWVMNGLKWEDCESSILRKQTFSDVEGRHWDPGMGMEK